ncbi:hypothetical protein DPMN_094487 [Dreissena polymorpha]|uniref:Uncharacterized protein n=1 Tax=Dreissena polymorpha TaxID=45954 RepID=A0A9D4R2Q2_DREPO|nr:hypothetical protein DPMN_094487 [Dreissena polymorpha]
MSCHHYRCTSDDRPPGYNEATTDISMESPNDIIIEEVTVDPPPPYGPPSYQQAMEDKSRESSCDNLAENFEVSEASRELIQSGFGAGNVDENGGNGNSERHDHYHNGRKGCDGSGDGDGKRNMCGEPHEEEMSQFVGGDGSGRREQTANENVECRSTTTEDSTQPQERYSKYQDMPTVTI